MGNAVDPRQLLEFWTAQLKQDGGHRCWQPRRQRARRRRRAAAIVLSGPSISQDMHNEELLRRISGDIAVNSAERAQSVERLQGRSPSCAATRRRAAALHRRPVAECVAIQGAPRSRRGRRCLRNAPRTRPCPRGENDVFMLAHAITAKVFAPRDGHTPPFRVVERIKLSTAPGAARGVTARHKQALGVAIKQHSNPAVLCDHSGITRSLLVFDVVTRVLPSQAAALDLVAACEGAPA